MKAQTNIQTAVINTPYFVESYQLNFVILLSILLLLIFHQAL